MTASTISTATALTRALEFVRQLDLPAPAPFLEGGAAPVDDAFLDPAQARAAAVGSGVVSFMQGLAPERRRAIAQGLLLAQLVANKRTPDRDRIDDWYQAYFDVLANLGWLIENREFAVHEASGRGVEAHDAILAVAATVLGAAPAALAVVKATLDALQRLGNDRGWIALFDRDRQSARAASFQLALVAGADDCVLKLMAFALEARASVTQAAFVKIRLGEATLRQLSTTVTIDPAMLAALQAEVAGRVDAFQRDYIRSLPPLV